MSNSEYRIPESFRSRNAEYITIPALKRFCRTQSLSTTDNRLDLLRTVENYAESSSGNMRIVYNWLDKVLKEGIKHVYRKRSIIYRLPKNGLFCYN